MTSYGISINLARTGGGPNPETDDVFRLTISGKQIGGHLTRREVLAETGAKLQQMMDALSERT